MISALVILPIYLAFLLLGIYIMWTIAQSMKGIAGGLHKIAKALEEKNNLV